MRRVVLVGDPSLLCGIMGVGKKHALRRTFRQTWNTNLAVLEKRVKTILYRMCTTLPNELVNLIMSYATLAPSTTSEHQPIPYWRVIEWTLSRHLPHPLPPSLPPLFRRLRHELELAFARDIAHLVIEFL